MVTLFGQSLSFILFSAGVVLAIMEALAPGAHFIVLGVALMFAGLAGLLFPALATPIVLAALMVVSGAGALFFYRRLDIYKGTDRGKTRSSESLSGARGRVVKPVTQNSGRVKLDRGGFDRSYAARSIDGEIPVGAEVVVVDPGGGNVVTVEQIAEIDEIDRELARTRRERTSETDREST